MATEVLWSDLDTWLQSQPANTIDTPYKVEIDGEPPLSFFGQSGTEGTIGYILNANNTKYVDLSFSSSITTDIFYSEEIDAYQMFYNCSSLTGITIDYMKTTRTTSMFEKCTSLSKVVWSDNIYGTDAHRMFFGCTSLTNFNIDGNVYSENVPEMFFGCTSLTRVSGDFKALSAERMFAGCTALKNILATLRLHSVELAGGMFNGCTSLTSVNLTTFTNLSDANIMFSGCKALTSVDLTSLTNLSDAGSMFYGCTSLASVDLTSLTNLSSASGMFNGCTALTGVNCSDLVNLEYASSMFYNCTSLKTVNFSTLSKLKDTESMFFGCSSLVEIDCSSFTSVTNAKDMFQNCAALTTVDASGFTSVETAWNMFRYCSSLKEINCSAFNNATNVNNMFYGCEALVNVFDWKVPIDSSAETCFYGCSSLEHIYINEEINDANEYHAWFLTKDEDNNQTGVKIFNIDGTSNTTVVPSSGDYDYSVTGKVDEIYSGSSITESDIEKVIATKYPMTQNKDAIDPTKDGFVLWAKKGSEVRTNIIKSTKYFIGESTSLTPKDDMEIFIQGQGVVVTLDNGTIPFGTIIKAYALNDTQISYYAGTEVVTNEIEVDGETQIVEETVDVTKSVSLVTGSKVEMGYINNKWQIIGTYGAVWN